MSTPNSYYGNGNYTTQNISNQDYQRYQESYISQDEPGWRTDVITFSGGGELGTLQDAPYLLNGGAGIPYGYPNGGAWGYAGLDMSHGTGSMGDQQSLNQM